jgi:GntR family transcriptional repressor for pyruvate dehydrogenase complex
MGDIFDFQLKRSRLSEQVVERIQALIVADSLRPGDKLPSERELAEQLDVSRTVVREAIRVLSVRGLVRAKPGCGTYVQEMSPTNAAASILLLLKLRKGDASLGNLYEVRRMIEVEAAGLAAARATAENIAALEDALANMRSQMEDPEAYAEYDLAFHAAIADATQNELFSILLNPISNLWQQEVFLSIFAPGAPEDGLSHHQNVLKWIKAREPEEARRAMANHIKHSEALVEAVHRNADSLQGDHQQ